MKVGTGFSQNPDPVALAFEASDKAMGACSAVRADLAVVFATPQKASDYIQLLETVKKVTGAKELVGSSTSGVITIERELEEGPACAVMVFEFEAKAMACAGHLYRKSHTKDALAWTQELKRYGSLLAVSDPVGFDPQPLSALAGAQSVIVFGGGAGGFTKAIPGAPVFHQTSFFREATVALGFNREFTAHLSVTYGFRALSPALKVTHAKENLVLELAGIPAAKVLERELMQVVHLQGKKIKWESPLPLLAGVLLEGCPSGNIPPSPWEFAVKPILAVDASSGGIVLGENLREGSRLLFVLREKEWADREFKSSLQMLKSKLGPKKPLFGFYFNGAERGQSLYGDKDHDVGLIRCSFGEFPLIGMFTPFELASQNKGVAVRQFTGVLSLFT